MHMIKCTMSYKKLSISIVHYMYKNNNHIMQDWHGTKLQIIVHVYVASLRCTRGPKMYLANLHTHTWVPLITA